jgi:hypothetical protein
MYAAFVTIAILTLEPYICTLFIKKRLPMKTLIFLLLMTVCGYTVSQEKGTRGTVKIQKNNNTLCKATVLGYNGTNFIKKEELFKAKKIELNKECNCEIISSHVTYLRNETKFYDFTTKGSSLKISDNASDTKKFIITSVFIDGILAKNKYTGKEIHLPAIEFKIID